MKILSTLIILLICANQLSAQTVRSVKGVVRDSSGLSVVSATVRLTSATDTIQTITDLDGFFTFNNVKSSQFLISINSLGYSNFLKRYLFAAGSTPLSLDPIVLKAQSNVLQEVVISGSAPVVVKQDTVEYRASDFPVRENSVAEDVIKRLPGVEVDKEGNVTTQGKSVTRIRVNGKDYFDGDLKTATQGLPADIIEKIQIVDDYGDQANISGIREGEADKIINITIRRDRMKGSVVSGTVGGGNDSRYQVSGNAQFMNNDRQTDVRLNLNNTNASPFNFGGGGGRGFGGGGGGGRGGDNNQGGGGNFFGNQGGISNVSAGGINYRDQPNKKLSLNGSYRFMVRNNNAVANSFGTSRYQELSINTESESNTKSLNGYHGGNFNVEYRFDSLNYIRVTPYVNISDSRSNLDRSLIQKPLANPGSTINQFREDQQTISLSNANSPSFGGNFIFNRRFKKLGRNFSVGFNLNNSSNENDQEINDIFNNYRQDNETIELTTDSVRNIQTSSQRFNANSNITYSEPIGKFGRLDFGYNYNLSDYKNSRLTEVRIGEVFQLKDDLSNAYDYSFTTNRFSLNYRFDRPKLYNFTVGLSAQPTLLQGNSDLLTESTRRTTFNVFPTARFSYNFARSRSLKVEYNGRSSEPSFNQIQPVRDVSNPLRPIIGNPELNSAFNQRLEVRYDLNEPSTGLFFNTGLFGNLTKDRIARNLVRYQQDVTVTDPVTSKPVTSTRTIQETRFLNTDGYYSTNAFYSLGKPFLEKKYRLSLNGYAGYTNDVTFINSEKNIGKNLTFSQNVRLQINPNANIEIYPAIGYRSTQVNYSLPGNNDIRANTWNYDLNGRLFFLKTFIFGFDVSKNVNAGYSSINANPLIINSYFEKQFFNKRGTFRLQGFDLLNEGTVVAISQDANTVVNSQTNRLTRYVMASFSFRIQKFPAGMQPKEINREGGEWRRNRD